MGIQVEYNPDLALRNFKEYEKGRRRLEECIPENLSVGETYNFFKKGQRNFYLLGEVPLLETKGNQQLSRPLASINILEATHLVIDGEVHTKGCYQVINVYDINDPTIHFEGFEKIK